MCSCKPHAASCKGNELEASRRTLEPEPVEPLEPEQSERWNPGTSERGIRASPCLPGRGQDTISIPDASVTPAGDLVHRFMPAPDDTPPLAIFPEGDRPPAHRPLERFWPYAELPESPTPEELAALDPDLHAALFGSPPRPFSFTLVFPKFDAPDYAEAVAMAKASPDYREVGAGGDFRHRARFFPEQAAQLRDLFRIVGRFDACEVLVDDRPVPYARELWLPLVWFLLIGQRG
jgi:hypothetical protein